VLVEVNQPLQASELLADCVTHLTKRWSDRYRHQLWPGFLTASLSAETILEMCAVAEEGAEWRGLPALENISRVGA